MHLTEKDYFIMTTRLRELADKFCNSRVVSVLEGGYHIPSLRRCSKEHVVALMMKSLNSEEVNQIVSQNLKDQAIRISQQENEAMEVSNTNLNPQSIP